MTFLSVSGVASDVDLRARDRLAALAHPGWSTAEHTGPVGGWVPTVPRTVTDDLRPGDGGHAVADEEQPRDGGDGRVLRDRALAAATAAYTAAHGHPLDAETLVGEPDRTRWATPARMASVACGVLVLVAVALGITTLGRTPTTIVADADVAPGPFRLDDPAPSSTVVVHVVGEVVEPGVVELDSGTRVADALDAVGGVGPEADLAGLNLARVLVDGEQVVVPQVGQVAAAPTDGRIDINGADAAALQTLPGIGEVLAHRIVAWREQNGRFGSAEELTQVSGIGPAVLESVRDLVVVG